MQYVIPGCVGRGLHLDLRVWRSRTRKDFAPSVGISLEKQGFRAANRGTGLRLFVLVVRARGRTFAISGIVRFGLADSSELALSFFFQVLTGPDGRFHSLWEWVHICMVEATGRQWQKNGQSH